MKLKMFGKARRLVMLALLCLVALIGAIVWYVSTPAQDHTYDTEEITRGDIEKTVLATGILKPALQVSVGAQVNGQLQKLYVKQGDRVTRGQLLAEIDPTLQQNALRKSEAALQSAEAQKQVTQATLKQYQLELKRQQKLDRDGSGVKSDLEKAQAQFQTQVAQLKVNDAQIVQAQMELETAKANLGFTRIVAPIDGEVLGIVTKEGQTIVSSQTVPTILVLADVDTMTVHTRISETDILKVRVGQPLWFYVVADPKQRYESVMGSIQEAPSDALREDNPSSSSNQQASAVYYSGVFAIANSKRLLRTSMTAQVFIITEQAKNALRVPVAAFGEQQGKDRYQVQVMNGKQLESRWVRIGLNDRQFAEVKEGLKEGDRVVLAGSASNG
ncbi:efflux RND transporter periplasmic adaptor subunit [Serratia fonticola]|uniref:Efflux RND transporter periplasmic adaptor subunit n=2 Tax=Serratia fonticola TaxID=47917 RepID=A0AAW3WRT1_SERFO|nr:efflux RND transporter periplasmic adaptor subunit [Serratia fonticola]MBC3212337.1 efflux RND transporter periplasmic adaptor subunit [Serratia fonticola]NYA12874.1 efflux RND transporter periplasmic adaptor subunit [Serratia fonticola]NYA32453.1 efflux RND transporter periplasmic adaptor subunit [Serratia fonticola]